MELYRILRETFYLPDNWTRKSIPGVACHKPIVSILQFERVAVEITLMKKRGQA